MVLKYLVLALGAIVFSLQDSACALKITGAAGSPLHSANASPVRLEISDLATSGPAFDLYILALAAFQALNQTEQLSYFQIAGIHGYPNVPWDGVLGRGQTVGYCMHFSPAFPLWHRPYLALFEQMVWLHAQEIALKYPTELRDRYRAAALKLRVPYWDWVVHPTLPAVVVSSKIFVNRPDGWHEITNPLYRYDFHPGPEGNGFPAGNTLSDARFTTRQSNVYLNQSDEAKVSAIMQQKAPGKLSLVYQLLSSTDLAWSDMSTAYVGGNQYVANNIESIHNIIHDDIGGVYGTMYYPEFAAFDPIFWLHHAQVDRLVALWQALNPAKYILPSPIWLGSYYEPAGTIDTVDTPLAPFHADSATTMFTPASIRDTTIFGYTYPELGNVTTGDPDQLASLRIKINALYNPDTAIIPANRHRRHHNVAGDVVTAFTNVTLHEAQQLGINNLEVQWTIRVRLDARLFNTSLTMSFFMGEPPLATTDWASAGNLIGTYSQLFMSDAKVMRSSYTKVGTLQGEVSLTHALAAGVSQGFLQDLSPDAVVPVLKAHLRWKARHANNDAVCLGRLSRSAIMVYSRKVKPSKQPSEFPIYGKFEAHPDAINSRSGEAAEA